MLEDLSLTSIKVSGPNIKNNQRKNKYTPLYNSPKINKNYSSKWPMLKTTLRLELSYDVSLQWKKLKRDKSNSKK